jgi:hypothetical protein
MLVGGLMVLGSFLLAAVLNRSAMDEAPATQSASPATMTTPANAPVDNIELAPNVDTCLEVDDPPASSNDSKTQPPVAAPGCPGRTD